MILRKPYAFLIKYFKIIHIILFLIFTYLVFQLRNIYMFFVNYVKNNNFTYFEGIANEYMNPLVFFMIILIIAFAISVYELMKKKEKPILFYKILIVYGFVLLIFWIYFRTFFTSLDKSVYDPLTIIIYRDVTAFLYYLNYFYVGFAFIRGFGFDIKRFSFDKDKRELHLDETDSEEYELNINLDKENVTNYIRREKREFRYYLKENASILIVLLIIAIAGVSYFVYSKFFVKEKIYQEQEVVTSNNINYRVNSSMITNLDKYSEEISNNNMFLVVNVTLMTDYEKVNFDDEMFRVNINDKYYYPSFSYDNLFDDLGNTYKTSFSLEKNNNFVIIFKYPKEEIKKSFFEILKSKNNGVYQFDKILLTPVIQKQEKNKLNYNEENTINNVSFQIIDYKIEEETSFEYENCYDGVCTKLNKLVLPNLNEKILSLQFNSENINKTFFEDYLGIKYKYSNKDVIISSKDVKLINQNKNILYFSIPKNSNGLEGIELVIKTRENEYSIELRENE